LNLLIIISYGEILMFKEIKFNIVEINDMVVNYSYIYYKFILL